MVAARQAATGRPALASEVGGSAGASPAVAAERSAPEARPPGSGSRVPVTRCAVPASLLRLSELQFLHLRCENNEWRELFPGVA